MLEQIIYTLNSIEVKGKDNLDKLLGCILMLEQMQAESNKQEENENGG